MRLSHSFVGYVTALGLAACGGSKTPHVIIDADSTDAPPDAFQCIFKNPGMFNPSAPLDFSTGMGQSMGQVPAGKTQLQTGANVNFVDENNQADGTGFGILMVNRGGVFSTAEAGDFEKPPTLATPFPMDEDDKAGFIIDFFDGLTASGLDPTQVYVLDSTIGTPTVTLDTFGKAVKATHTKIGATTKTATFVGFNVDGDDTQPNDCQIEIVNFTFTNLDVLWQTADFPPPPPAALAQDAALEPIITKTADGRYHFNREAWHARHDSNVIRMQRP